MNRSDTFLRGSFALLVGLGVGLAACGRPPSGAQLVEGMIPTSRLVGARVEEPNEQPARVYLPPSYHHSNRRYPVIYYLPGFTTEVQEYFDGTVYGLDLAGELERRHLAGLLPELLFVVANGRSRLGGSFYVDSPVTGDWESFLVEDVVGWVDESFRTIPRRDARALMGDSMGGAGALRIGMRHADRFSVVYGLNPGLFAPGGLEASGLASPHRWAATEWWRRRVARGSDSSPAPSLAELSERLFDSHERFGSQLAFTWAYSAAFAPGLAPRLLPATTGRTSESPAQPVSSEELRRALEEGFGDLESKVRAHRKALLGLKGLVLDCGVNDPLVWIPEGCRYLAELLDSNEVPNELRLHEGGHLDRLPERLTDFAIPFVVSRLAPPY